MKIAENEKYLIVDTEDENLLNPIFIFNKKNNKYDRYNKIDIIEMECSPFKEEQEIGQLYKENTEWRKK